MGKLSLLEFMFLYSVVTLLGILTMLQLISYMEAL
ncbi:hypothetical protein BTT_65430 (plasmid) [Bacillus thuringiensis serovar morrisoni str. 4AA1]|nr:hypothetical protein BTT_65430 [Bacillus thuringiensis serovar morrisoni str. 4AA1]